MISREIFNKIYKGKKSSNESKMVLGKQFIEGFLFQMVVQSINIKNCSDWSDLYEIIVYVVVSRNDNE